MIRRCVALALVFSFTVSSAEAVVGAVRDGSVHHEDTASAAAHASQSRGEHEHEDASPHGPRHSHGTAADHCTHQHGTAVTTACAAPAFMTAVASHATLDLTIWSNRSLEIPLHPPRA